MFHSEKFIYCQRCSVHFAKYAHLPPGEIGQCYLENKSEQGERKMGENMNEKGIKR
jgi:hypothetical protein